MVQKFPGDLLSGILSLHLCTTKYFFTPCAQGLMEGEASRSSAKWARIEAPHAGAENRSGEEWEGGHLPIGSGEGSLHCPPQNFFLISGSRNACFVASALQCVQVQISSTPAQSDIQGWLWLDQRRWSSCRLQRTAPNIIFPGDEYATNLIIANVKTLSHNDSNSRSFSSDGHEFGGHGPLVPSGSANVSAINAEMSN